jgi:hypothetical protein
MANKTITQLSANAALTGVEELAVWQSGATVKTEVDDVAAYAQGRSTWTEAVTGRALARTDIVSGVKSTSGAVPNFSIPNSLFVDGDVVKVLNASGNQLTITPDPGFTLLRGNVAPGVATVAARTVAYIYFTAYSEAYITGTGVS